MFDCRTKKVRGDYINMLNKKSTFFTPTQRYKEYMILNMLSKNSKISQRDISESLGIAVSMVNMYLAKYEELGYLTRSYKTPKDVEYLITEKGISRKEELNIGYLSDTQKLYSEAKENIIDKLRVINENGYHKIIFYGAGEVAEIMLSILNDKYLEFDVLAIIDDNIEKQGKKLVGKDIISLDDIYEYTFDGIIISAYTNDKKIYQKLIDKNISEEKIISIF